MLTLLQTQHSALGRSLSVNKDSVDIQSGYFSIKMEDFYTGQIHMELVLYITYFKTLPISTIGSNTQGEFSPAFYYKSVQI